RSAHSLGQQIIIAESDGLVRQREPITESIGSLLPPKPQTLDRRQPSDEGGGPSALKGKGVTYFKQLIGQVLMMDGNLIDSSEPLSVYGVDSIIIAQLTNALKDHFEGVNTGLLFEVSTIDGLVNHFAEAQRANFAKLLGLEDEPELQGTRAQ